MPRSSAKRPGMIEMRSQRIPAVHRSPRQTAHNATPRRTAGRRSDAINVRSTTLSPGTQNVSESRMIEQDSDLHDYDQGPGKTKEDHAETDTDGDEDAANVPGVLGMLAQLKTQAEKGTGVNI